MSFCSTQIIFAVMLIFVNIALKYYLSWFLRFGAPHQTLWPKKVPPSPHWLLLSSHHLSTFPLIVLTSLRFLLNSNLPFVVSGQKEGTRDLECLHHQSHASWHSWAFLTVPGSSLYLGFILYASCSRPNPVTPGACQPVTPCYLEQKALRCQVFFSSSGGTDSSWPSEL